MPILLWIDCDINLPRMPLTRILHCPRRCQPWLYPQKSEPRIFSWLVTTDDAIPLIMFLSVNHNDNPAFFTVNYSWQKCISILLTALEKFCTDVSSGCSVFNDKHFQHPPYTDFTVVKFSDDDHKCQFSNSYCGAQITGRDAEIIQNQCINVICGLYSLYHGWSAAALSVTSVTARKTTDPASDWTNICGILTIHASKTSMNLYKTGVFHNSKFSHLSAQYICPQHPIFCIATVLTTHNWLEHLCPGGAGQFHSAVGKARNCTWWQIKKKFSRHYFYTSLCINLHKTCFEIVLPSMVVWYHIKAYVNWKMTWGQSPKL